MRHFGIIGKPVAQSFSARYFTEKFTREGIDAQYERYELDRIEDIPPYLDQLDGFNVTIPYKQAIIPFLAGLDDTARQIGAVNVVNKKHIGYNTDCIGFMDSIRPLLLPTDRYALVLGTGGAAKAVHYGLEQLGIQATYVSRNAAKHNDKGFIGYEELTKQIIEAHTVIVNCTPLGMWPNMNDCAQIPYQYITAAHLLYDCVYNPEQTLFLKHGKEQGARTMNGLGMLYGQAEAAWRIWKETK